MTYVGIIPGRLVQLRNRMNPILLGYSENFSCACRNRQERKQLPRFLAGRFFIPLTVKCLNEYILWKVQEIPKISCVHWKPFALSVILGIERSYCFTLHRCIIL
jgi:hypothetical protein